MYTRALIVAGHAIFSGGPNCPIADVTNDSKWTLLPYQLNEPQFYVAQIRKAVDLAEADSSALLIFSGGFTRGDAGRLSEAQGYCDVASTLGLLCKVHGWTLEERSRDSFDNCLFGISRFAEFTGRLPERVTMVSWEFKRARFLQHMDTIQFPLNRFDFVGEGMPDKADAAIQGEAETVRLFEADKTGYGPVLKRKKDARNPFELLESYSASVPALAPLLSYRGTIAAPTSICPWTIENKIA